MINCCKNKKIYSSLILITLMLFGLFSITPEVQANNGVDIIKLVQGPKTSENPTFTLDQTPTSGNLLIATIGTYGATSYESVSSVSETGVTWTKQVSAYHSTSFLNSEIWAGVVGSSASASITITVNFPLESYGLSVVVCEYNGTATSGFLDRSANYFGAGGSAVTGTTDATTQITELCIGSISATPSTYSQSSPLNGYTLYGGSSGSFLSQAYLQKIVSSTGVQSSGTTLSGANGVWVGCIATFKSKYYLTVSSSHGSPSGEGLYSPGASATFGVTTVEGHTFNGWVGTGAGSYTGTALAYTITMNNAITETASWTEPTNTTSTSRYSGDAGGISGGSIFDVMATNASLSSTFFTGLVGYWNFDEGSGITAIDNSGNSNTGTLVNTPSWVQGKFGGALNFVSASSQYMSLSSNLESGLSTATWAFWAKGSSTNTPSVWIGHVGGPMWIGYSSTQQIGFGVEGGDTYTGIYMPNSTSWQFICMTYNGSTVTLYLNGVNVWSASKTFSPSGNTVIGSTGAANYLTGSIDDVRIYNISLSQTQITQLYTTPPGSYYTVSTVQPNFQSFSTTVNLYQGAIWYTGDGNETWDAPTYCFNTGYLEYGVSYVDPVTNITCPGWYVRISVVGGAAGTISGSDNAYVELACAWFNNDELIKTDVLFCAYDAYRANDTTTQFDLYVNLWLSSQNGNSMVGGAVTAVYYGVTSTGWGPWATWGPVNGLLSSSIFYGQLYDSTDTVIIASALQNNTFNAGIFNVWTTIAKTGIGSGPYSDNLHVWAATCKSLEFNNLPIGAILVGVNTPAILPTTMFDNPLGFFAQIGSSITSALNSMNQAFSTMVSSASGVTASVLDNAFSAIGVSNAATSISSFASTIGGYFSSAASYISLTIIPIFQGIANFGMFVVSWVGSMITTIINIGTYVTYILTGAAIPSNAAFGNFGSLGNILGQTVDIFGQAISTINMLIASGAFFILLFVWWVDSIDKRAKQYGGGWMSFFMSDIQSIISVMSFIFDMAWRVITTTISLGTQFLNLFL
jgi:hypothetical protein